MILVNKYGSFPNLPFWKVNKGYEDDQTMNFPNAMTQIADLIIMSKQGKYFTSLSKNGKIKDIYTGNFQYENRNLEFRRHGMVNNKKT